jgi:hypothetical protein
MKEFGEALRQAREEAHLTLEEVYERTRISIKHLRAIEAGDFPAVPQTYVRAFIREYAQLVGLDDVETLAAYNELAARDKGIPKPPEAHDNSNILPHLDESIEIIKPGSVVPRHVEVQGTPEPAAAPTTAEPSRKPVHVETVALPRAASVEPAIPAVEPLSPPEPAQDVAVAPSTESMAATASTGTPGETVDPAPPQPAAAAPDTPGLSQDVSEADIAHAGDHKVDEQKRKLRSDLFKKMITPEETPVPAQAAEPSRPKKSVYDTKPPIPSESSTSPQPTSPPTPPPVKKTGTLDSGEKRTLVVGAIVVLIISVSIYALIHFNSGSEQKGGLVDSSSIKASLEQGKFLDSSQHAMMEQPQVQPDTSREQLSATANPELVKKASFKDDSLTLEAFTNSPVWFQVKMDTTRSERGSLNTNEHKVWKAKDRFFITLGDAGAVTFFLNGKEIGALGDEGAVVKNVVISRHMMPSGN